MERPATGVSGERESVRLSPCVCSTLRMVSRAVTQLYDDILRPSGLRVTQFSILATIARRGEANLRQLEHALVIDQTTLTRSVHLLERDRVIERVPNPDGLAAIAWCKLQDGSNESVNRRWQDYTGIPEDEARGQGWQAAVHPDDLPKLTEKWAEIVASGQGGEFEGRLRRRDGVFCWFLARFEPVRDDAGEIVRWYGTSTDIDALKQAEAKLREDERALRRITDAIPQAIVVQDPDGIPVYANQAVLDYTGLTMDDVLTADFRAGIFHSEDLKHVREQRQAALADGLPFELELRALSKDGQYRWFLTCYKPFHDEQGRLVSWYATGTDIDDRKRAEDRTRNENVALREEIVRSSMFEEIVGSSDALRTVVAQVAKVAPTDATVLIQGETGTSKELIARAIHNRSRRANRAFIRVNCAAFPLSLIASELFGHGKGAFTGALQRRYGRVEAADGGTSFFDRSGERAPQAHIALLAG